MSIGRVIPIQSSATNPYRQGAREPDDTGRLHRHLLGRHAVDARDLFASPRSEPSEQSVWMKRSQDELTFGPAGGVKLSTKPGNEVRRLFAEPDLDVGYLLVDDDDAPASGTAAIVSINEV